MASLNENSNIPLLAQKVVEKCRLIHSSKLPLIETLLQSLKEHKVLIDRSSILPVRQTPIAQPLPCIYPVFLL